MGKVTIKWFVDFGDKHGAMIMTMTVVSMTMMRTNKGMKDANYKCRAQAGNASCIQSLALPLMQKELGLLIIWRCWWAGWSFRRWRPRLTVWSRRWWPRRTGNHEYGDNHDDPRPNWWWSIRVRFCHAILTGLKILCLFRLCNHILLSMALMRMWHMTCVGIYKWCWWDMWLWERWVA